MGLLFWKDFLDLIFPRNCPLCGGNLLDFEECFCVRCQGTLPKANFHLRPYDNELTRKIQGLTQVNRAMAFLRFSKKGKSQKILHLLKYRHKPEIGVETGKLYGQELQNAGFQSEWDLITAVPLHPLKKMGRGYNQSERFAEGLSNSLGVQTIDLIGAREIYRNPDQEIPNRATGKCRRGLCRQSGLFCFWIAGDARR